MKRFFLASLAVVCVGLALATAQTINRSVQLSFDSNGLIGFSTQNAMFIPGKLHTNNSASPTFSGFGTNPSPTGTDMAGEVTMNSGTITGGTITFRTAYPSTPYCTGASNSAASPVAFYTSPNGISVTFTTNLAYRFYYICVGARAS